MSKRVKTSYICVRRISPSFEIFLPITKIRKRSDDRNFLVLTTLLSCDQRIWYFYQLGYFRSAFAKVFISFSVLTERTLREVQWLEHSPPTNVTRAQIPVLMPYEGWVCCWFSPLLLREVFSGHSGFPLSSKPNIFYFQFDQEWQTKNHYVNVLPQKSFFIIYLFY